MTIMSETVLKHVCTMYESTDAKTRIPSRTEMDACITGQPTVLKVPTSLAYDELN